MPISVSSEQKQTWFWLTVGLALLVLMLILGPVMAPFLAGAILAYALNPAVDWFAARRLRGFAFPRALAVVLVIAIVAAAILSLALTVEPVLEKELPLLQQKIPVLLAKLNQYASPWLQKHGIRVRLDSAGLQKLLSQRLADSGDDFWVAALSSAKVGGITLLGWIGNLVLIPVVLFYLLLDWHGLVRRIQEIVPRRWVSRTTRLTLEVNALLAQYLRGQAAVMIVLAIYYSTALALAGFDIALPIGVLTGMLIFIPYLGYGLGLILALLAALLQFDGAYGLAAVAVIYGFGQMLEGFFLTPRLVGERIGLHPLAVIFALLAFGQLFGFVGILLALPASAIVSVAFRHLRAHYLDSSFYSKS